MSEIDRDIEKLIVRSLDGELNDEDQLRLDRELIRDPEARQTLEEYRSIDARVVDALNEAFPSEPLSVDVASLTQQKRKPRLLMPARMWWLVPGAVAAAFLAIMLARLEGPQIPDSGLRGAQPLAQNGPADRAVPIGQELVPSVGSPISRPENLMHSVGTVPAIQRSTGRDVIGVLGEDGNIYLLEVNRTRTLRKFPRPGRSRGYVDTL